MFWRVRATQRKQLPPMGVAAAGGWLDIGTLQQCYQQCDDDTLRSGGRIRATPNRSH